MAFLNPSFETVDSSGPGCADGWTFSSTSRGGLWTSFHTPPDHTPWEDFEREWDSNEDYLFELDPLAISEALYTAATPPKTYEDFEEQWSSNQLYVYGIAGTLATYSNPGAQAYESFNGAWNSNQSYLYAFVGVGSDLTAAEYDVANEDFENFEEEWFENEDYVFAFVGISVDLTAALYSGNQYENFENPGGAWPVCNTV